MAGKKAAKTGKKEDAHEEIEHITAGEKTEPEVVEEKGEKVHLKSEKDRMYEKVRITIPVELKIKKRVFHAGTHIVERHQLETILEMVNKKQRANMEVFTGKNYLVEKMVSGALRVTQVDELNSKTLIGV